MRKLRKIRVKGKQVSQKWVVEDRIVEKEALETANFSLITWRLRRKGLTNLGRDGGDRKLEDNWRRLDSQSFNTFDDEDVEEEEEKEITDA